MFREAKKLGDRLVVIVNNDKQQLMKKKKIIMDESERVEIVQAIRDVSSVILSVDEDASVCKTLEKIARFGNKSDELVFANGGDRRVSDDILEADVCKYNDIETVFGVGGGKIHSSSEINERRGQE